MLPRGANDNGTRGRGTGACAARRICERTVRNRPPGPVPWPLIPWNRLPFSVFREDFLQRLITHRRGICRAGTVIITEQVLLLTLRWTLHFPDAINKIVPRIHIKKHFPTQLRPECEKNRKVQEFSIVEKSFSELRVERGRPTHLAFGEWKIFMITRCVQLPPRFPGEKRIIIKKS